MTAQAVARSPPRSGDECRDRGRGAIEMPTGEGVQVTGPRPTAPIDDPLCQVASRALDRCHEREALEQVTLGDAAAEQREATGGRGEQEGRVGKAAGIEGLQRLGQRKAGMTRDAIHVALASNGGEAHRRDECAGFNATPGAKERDQVMKPREDDRVVVDPRCGQRGQFLPAPPDADAIELEPSQQ